MIRSAAPLARRLATTSLPKRAAIRTNPLPSLHHSTTTLPSSTPSHITTRFSSSSRALSSILSREIAEETEAGSGTNTMPPELEGLYNDMSKNWNILQGLTGIGSSNGATVRMFRKENASNGSKIGIVFHCQDTEEDNSFDEDMFNDDGGINGERDEEEEEAGNAVRFAVTVSKGGQTVVMQCRAADELSVEGVAVREGDTESALVALAGGEQLNASLYQGPEFTELAEDLQEAFHTYVEKECGVDEDVTAFITMYADYREQEEYVAWMKTANSVLG
ncbi:hypothetical protein ACHAWO_006726 [Cyclotella atomus]|uniref:Mitochondrial glycoprotein n=1 Tax=Cyclotella atomus TaxID=382360 RepID=A0ABD3MM87_9STRA